MDECFELQQQEIEVLKSIYLDKFILVENTINTIPKPKCEEDSDEEDGFQHFSSIRKSKDEIIIDKDNISKDNTYFQIKVSINLPDDFKIQIKRDDVLLSGKDNKKPDDSEEFVYYPIISLPDISLNFRFEEDYPIESPPLLQITCCWLTIPQMKVVINHLDSLFEKGELVIFKYIDWLKDNLLQFLKIDNGFLTLSGDHRLVENGSGDDILPGQEGHEYPDDRVHWESDISWTSLLSTLPLLLSHSSHENKRVFHLNSHECPICYCEYPAKEMTLLQCNHFLCNECLSQCCNINIQSKNIHLLKCTEPNCNKEFDFNIIQRASTKENFEKYQDLVKESKGYVKCSRCIVGWSLIDTITQSTFCNSCFFSMCLLCTNPFHPGILCHEYGVVRENNMVYLKKRKEITSTLDEKLNAYKQEYFSEKIFFLYKCKPCPSCHTMIFKYDGCNKVCCTQCETKFCFLCSKIIHSYEHFSTTSCQLFEMPSEKAPNTFILTRAQKKDIENERKKVMDYNSKFKRGEMNCLRCKEVCFRFNNNNHLLCDCKTQMCFLCKQVINGTKHFQTSDCVQHGDK